MRGIAAALKRQRLRKTYPCGVNITPINVRGQEAYAALTNLKNGYTFEPILYTGYLANLSAALHREALIKAFQAAGFMWRNTIYPRFHYPKERIVIHYAKTPK